MKDKVWRNILNGPYTVQGEADNPCAMYEDSDRTEFDES